MTVVSWRSLAVALRVKRAEKRVERVLAQSFVQGPHTSSRAIRRANGERGHGYGLGAAAPSLKTRGR
jgi:hypothetical protein